MIKMNYMQNLLACIVIAMLVPQTMSAQKKGFSYDFYGSVRNDIFLSSRQSQTSEEGSFYLFPLDKVYDAEGKDLNAGADLNMYNMRTRLGVNVPGPELFGAKHQQL